MMQLDTQQRAVSVLRNVSNKSCYCHTVQETQDRIGLIGNHSESLKSVNAL